MVFNSILNEMKDKKITEENAMIEVVGSEHEDESSNLSEL